ncbi:MAG: sulfide/dihydroorotate dehydrogenase-like FAD/NAD-binding protein [Endomicrobiaceae bacterium]|jgi:ferredoxin--NADP+ reductase|nr:sulfide/dihydroorotate dehydrogenase-like FAD/NAD-binding protein [Endomicrobiaceae bacterium]MDD4165699.1 sulfide/dihydroorotate dehydrogenase-like FAD/NAD-binding protein [Endomicrobiaceae bacterium]
MFKIISKKILSSNIKSFEISAPDIAKNAKAGQFVILRLHEKGERIPLTIAGTDAVNGTIRIIFQEAGKTTTELGTLNEGQYIRDVLGPLGHPTEIKNCGTIVAVAGGVGTAEVLPVIKSLLKAGNKVITIVGARNKDLLILEDELKENSSQLLIATDDGSYGVKGFVTNILADVISKEKINIVYAIGPVPMMKAVSNMTKEHNIETLVSLNPIMVDGTGMCGACRVRVNGKIKFACVDGPEFDAHKVNWDELVSRLSLFKKYEAESFENFKHNPECKCHKE